MVIISHRGESIDYPENSMSAFYKAYFDQSNGIEMDVRKTKDDKLVLCHDKKINRVSSSSGKISKMTYDELLKVDFNREKIVLLEDIFKYLGNKNFILIVEIKDLNIEKNILDLIEKYNLNNIILACFNIKTLENIRKLNNNIRLAYLVYFINDKTILDSIYNNISIVIGYSNFIGIDDVLECHKNNILVYAWGIKDYNKIKWFEIIDVDGIIVDNYKEALNYKNK